jgi:hypothetical protein
VFPVDGLLPPDNDRNEQAAVFAQALAQCCELGLGELVIFVCDRVER